MMKSTGQIVKEATIATTLIMAVIAVGITAIVIEVNIFDSGHIFLGIACGAFILFLMMVGISIWDGLDRG